jgi:hypothetical protein
MIKRTEISLTGTSNLICKNVVTLVTIDIGSLGIDWEPNKGYRIALEPGFVKEPDGNQMPIDGNDSLLSFTTNPPLEFLSTVPSDLYPEFLYDTTPAPVTNNTTLFIQFNRNRYTPGEEGENVDFSNPASSLRLYREDISGDVLVGQFYSTDPRIDTLAVSFGINFDVRGLLREDARYYVLVDANYIVDLDGFSNAAFDGRVDGIGAFTTADAETYPVLQSDFVSDTNFFALPGYRQFGASDFLSETTQTTDVRRFVGVTSTHSAETAMSCEITKFTGFAIFQPVQATLFSDADYTADAFANLNSTSALSALVGEIEQFESIMNSSFAMPKATVGFRKTTPVAMVATSTLQLLPSDLLLFNISTAGVGMISFRRTGYNNWIQNSNNYGTGLIVPSDGSENFRTYFPRTPNSFRHWSKYSNSTNVASVLRRSGLTFTTVASGTISLQNNGGFHAFAGVNRDGTSIASRDDAGLNIYNVSGSNLTLKHSIANTDVYLASWNPANANELVYNTWFNDTFRLLRRDNFASNFSQRSSTSTNERSSGFLWHPSGEGLFVSYSNLGTLNSSQIWVRYYERTGDTFTLEQEINWDLYYPHISETISHWHPSGSYFVSGSHNESNVIKLWSWNKSSGLTLLQTISVAWDTGVYNMAWTSDGNNLIVAGSSPTTPRLYQFQDETLSLVGTMDIPVTYNSPLFIAN